MLAATLGASYGIYGPPYENLRPRRSPPAGRNTSTEKYQLRHWDWDKPNVFREFIALVNRVRRENPALQSDHRLRFYPTDNEQPFLLREVNGRLVERGAVRRQLDPHHPVGLGLMPVGEFGLTPDSYQGRTC